MGWGSRAAIEGWFSAFLIWERPPTANSAPSRPPPRHPVGGGTFSKSREVGKGESPNRILMQDAVFGKLIPVLSYRNVAFEPGY